MTKKEKQKQSHLDKELEAIKLILKIAEPLLPEQRYRLIGALAVLYGLATWSWK